ASQLQLLSSAYTLGLLGRAAMKCCALFVLLALAASAGHTQEQNVPEIPYRSVPSFLKMPADTYLGEVSGVAVNSKGHVFIFSRGNTTGPAYGAAAAQL